METNCVNILLVDSRIAGASRIKSFLKQGVRPSCEIWHHKTQADALRFLQQGHVGINVVLLDVFLDSINPEEIYELIDYADVPVIVITNKHAHSLACEVTARGAADVIIRERFEVYPQRLLDAIEFSLIRNKLLSDLKERYEGEVDHHKRMLHWMTGGYSVDPTEIKKVG